MGDKDITSYEYLSSSMLNGKADLRKLSTTQLRLLSELGYPVGDEWKRRIREKELKEMLRQCIN